MLKSHMTFVQRPPVSIILLNPTTPPFPGIQSRPSTKYPIGSIYGIFTYICPYMDPTAMEFTTEMADLDVGGKLVVYFPL